MRFQELLEAKETALKWLLGYGDNDGDIRFDSDSSDDDLKSSSDGDSDCEGEGHAELKVCGIDIWRGGSESPPAQLDSTDEFDEECRLGGDFGVAAAKAA